MKPRHHNPFRSAALTSLGLALSLSISHATSLTWDGGTGATTTDDTATGGAGTWTTGVNNWDDGISNSANGSWTDWFDAIFGGTAGVVSLAANVNVHNLTFNSGGYTIQSNTLTLGGSSPTINTAADTTTTINSNIIGSAGLIKSGAGTLLLGGTNTYTGATRIEGGTLSIAYAVNLPSGSALTLANGSTLLVNNSNTAVNNALTIASGDSGVIKCGTVGVNQQVNGSLSGVAGNLILDVSNASGGGLQLVGTAMGATTLGSTVTLLSTGGYTSYIILNSDSSHAVFSNSKVVVSKSGGGSLNIQLYGSSAEVQFGALDGGNSSCSFTYGSANSLKITGTADGNYAGNTGVISNVTKIGAGTQQFTGTGITYTGTTIISSGRLKLNDTTSFASSGITMNGGTLELNRTTGTWSYNNVIAVGSGAGNLVKSGAGTVTLGASNTFTGATIVHGGTLALGSGGSLVSTSLVVGDTGSSGAVFDVSAKSGYTVANGVTLSGVGTVNAGVGKTLNLGNGAIHAVGNGGVGVQNVTGNLSYAGGSIFEWSLNAVTSDPGANALNSGTFDQVGVTGSLGGVGAAFKIVLGSNAFGDAFWNSNKSWNSIFAASPGFDLNSIFTSFSGEGIVSNGSVTGQGGFTLNGNTLTWTAVPEPTSALAGLLLGAGLLRRRRRTELATRSSF